MKLPFGLVLLFEKLGAIAFMLVPEGLILRLKKLLRGKEDRSKFLSSTADYFDMRIRKGLNNFDMVCRSSGFSFAGKTVLEFGTGGHGLDLVLLYLLGVKKIYTVDIKFFGLLNLPLAIRDAEKFLPDISRQFLIPEASLRNKHAAIASKGEVGHILKEMNVQFVTFRELMRSPEILADPIDFFFSESNLQRIPLDEIYLLFQKISKGFSPQAVAFHRVDCNDINVQSSRPLYDPNLWNLEYLKYSDIIWNLITTRRFGSQNRLRQAHFVQLFRDNGFHPVWIENYYSHGTDVERMKTFGRARKFRDLPSENVAITHFRLVASRALPASVTERFFTTSGSFPQPRSDWSEEKGLMA